MGQVKLVMIILNKVVYQNNIFLCEECMAGDVNLFLDDSRRDVAEIEIMIAGKKWKL